MALDARLTLRQLEQLVALADAGTFVGAAERVRLTPNAVAQNVSELERIAGAALTVRRRAKGVSLTPAGERLAARARALLRQAEEVLEAADDAADVRGPVRVGCHSTLAPTVLPRLWEAVAEAMPGVELTMVDGDSDVLAEWLRRGEIDVAVTYAVNLTPDLATAPLVRLGLKVSLPGGHRLADREAVDLADLDGEPLVLLDRAPSGANSLNILRRRGLNPRIAQRVGDMELMRAFVARGAGYGLHFTTVDAVTSRDGLPVVSRPVAPSSEVEPVVLAWDAAVEPTARTRAVMEVCRATFPG